MEYYNARNISEHMLRFIQHHEIKPLKEFELLLKAQNPIIKNDYEYVDYALSILQHTFTNDLRGEVKASLFKCPAEANRLRNLGNIAFKSGLFLKAHNLYTLSIARGKFGSNELSLAYGNRSAVLFEKQYYKECLEDIQRALDNNYPSDKKAKLLMRQSKARQLLPTQKKVPFHGLIPKIEKKNTAMPSASDCIRLTRNEEFGRHMVANRTINPGETLLVEKPYSQCVFFDTLSSHCSECLELCFNLIPCEKCAGVLYCSITCRRKAYVDYHRYECVIFSYFGLDVVINWSATRMTLKGIQSYKNKNTDSVYRSDRYKEISELMSDKSTKDSNLQSLILSAVGAAKVFYVLKKATDIFSVFDIDEKENILKNLLFNDNCIEQFNSLQISKRDADMYVLYGRAIYSALSMFNHACNENVGISFYGCTVALKAVKKINRGEQCFINYGVTPITNETTDRQLYTHGNFNFICKCQACVQGWPREEELFGLGAVRLMYELKGIFTEVAVNDIIDQHWKKVLLKKTVRIMELIQEQAPCLVYKYTKLIFNKILHEEANTHISF